MSVERKLNLTSGRAAWASVAIGALCLLGWAFNVPLLRGTGGTWPELSRLSALCVIAAGLGCLLLRGTPRTLASFAGWSLAVLVSAAGLLSIGNPVIFSAGWWPLPHDPGMSPHTAVAFTLTGLALGGLGLQRRSWFNPSVWLGFAIFGIGLFDLVNYLLPLLGAPEVTGPARTSLPGAVALLAIGLAVATARLGRGFQALLADQDHGPLMTPRTLTLVVLLPIGLYAAQVLWVFPDDPLKHDQLALFTIAFAIGMAGVLATSMRHLQSLDRAKTQSEAERDNLLARLQQQAASLQSEVAHRTAELKAALQQSLRFDHLARSTHSGVIILDAAGQIEWLNPAWESIMGYTLAEVRGRRPSTVLHGPDTDLALADSIQSSMQRGVPARGEVINYRKDRVALWIALEVQPIYGTENRITGYFVIHTDITQRKQQESRMLELNERLDLALRSSHFGVWDWDLVEARGVWDDRQCALYGFAPGQFDGRKETWYGLLHPEDREAARARILQAISSENVYDHTFRIVRPDGTVRHIESFGTVYRDGTGKAVRIVGLNRDITTEREREQEVNALTQRLQFVANSAGFGIWEFDYATDAVFWDDQACRIFGVTREQLTHRTADWEQRVHPDDLPRATALHGDVEAGRSPHYEIEYRIIRPDGAVRTVEAHGYIVRNPDGSPKRMVGYNRDITDTRALREELRVTEERWRLALSSNNDGVWDWNIATGEIFRDARIAEIVGFRPDEIATDRHIWQSLGHPEDIPASNAALAEHLEGRRPLYESEYRLRHKLGHWIWVLDRGKVIDRDAKDQPLRMAGTQTDITPRKQLEERLRHGEEMSLQLGRLAQIGAWEWDLVSTKLTWSPEMFRVHEVELGYEPTLAKALDFYPPIARATLSEALQHAVRAGNGFDLELPFTTARGNKLWVRVLGRAEIKDGHATRVYGAFQDITGRRDAEEMRRQLEGQLFQAQKMETLGTLAGGIAHDFNNLLTGILGYQDLALDSLPEGDAARNYLMASREASLRARELVDQILTFSRQAGSEKVPVNLAQVVEDARRFLRATVPATVKIEVDIAPDCGRVLADATQIHQVLLNLGSNAAHAMRSTGGTMHLALAPVTLDSTQAAALSHLEPGQYIRLDCRDTGHGMDEETQKRIFDPFFTTKEVGQGTGLGLSVVHGIMQAHRGAITVWSAPGQGATFTLYLPVAEASIEEEIVANTLLPRGTGELIAVVDDEDIVRSFAQMALEKTGYRVASFDSPAQCLEAVRKRPDDFALLLTDQTMPVMKGIELAAEVRGLSVKIPIVIMSGYFSRISPEKLAQIGHVSLLSKPFTNDELARTVHRTLYPDGTPAPTSVG